ncbi:hypothetical protein C1H46_010146 [Malus baccata]|uniref:Uncharacterized protein n=1 Tax=Malus baccata TaxID=106549 RepID=A0A540N141_MALBA|nr:hypothetical protein C1H46_010146 [Malus baccata]
MLALFRVEGFGGEGDNTWWETDAKQTGSLYDQRHLTLGGNHTEGKNLGYGLLPLVADSVKLKFS